MGNTLSLGAYVERFIWRSGAVGLVSVPVCTIWVGASLSAIPVIGTLGGICIGALSGIIFAVGAGAIMAFFPEGKDNNSGTRFSDYGSTTNHSPAPTYRADSPHPREQHGGYESVKPQKCLQCAWQDSEHKVCCYCCNTGFQ